MSFIDLKRLSLFVLILTLWGCAHKPAPLQLPAGWVIQKQQLEAMTDWQIKGKLAYKRSEQAFSANLRWQQVEQTGSLKLFNALGITLVDMSITPERAILEADGETYTDTNAESLLLQTTGWDIPVENLKRWIKGLPDDKDTITFNKDGTVKTLYPACTQCRKWVVEYTRFMQVDDLVLPNALTIRDVSQPNAFIKLRISSWR